MSDGVVKDSGEVKQSKSTGKAGARDAKAMRNNANRSVESAGMPDLEKEREVAKKLGGRQHGAHQPRTIERVLRLAGQGYSPSQMHRAFRGIPHPDTIYRWMDEEPEFGESFKARQRHFIDDEMRQQLPLVSAWKKDSKHLRSMLKQAKGLLKVTDLKPFEQVQAIDRMLQRSTDLRMSAVLIEEKGVHRTMQIAARQLPNDWGEHTEGESAITIIDVGLGAIKTIAPPGSSDGQNAKALEAGRWKALPAPSDAGKDANGA